MMTTDTEMLINRIHEAGLVPELWPALLSELGASVGGNGGILFGLRDGYANAIASNEHRRHIGSFMNDGWAARDLLLKRGIAFGHPGFFNDGAVLSEHEIATDDVYENFYRKHGIGYRAASIIPIPNGDSIGISVLRHQDNGPVPQKVISFLDGMRPHLARAALTSNRLGFEKALAQAEALQAIGLPGALLRGPGKLFVANALFEALVPSIFQDRSGRVAIADTSADALLANTLATLNGRPSRSVKSIAIAATAQRMAMVLHLVPVRGAANDIFSQATALLIVTPVNQAAVPTSEVLQGLFDLTPAEARVARGIGLAQSIETLATANNVSPDTVRTQLKAVLAKVGLKRQQELVSLLAGKAWPAA